jgi:putative transposase
MADNTSVDLAGVRGGNPVQASPDLLRAMVQTFAEALMGADADALCGAPYRQPSAERVNYRNRYRQRRWDTRAGTIDLAILGCGRAVTSRSGCWNGGGGLSRR